ncbi:MAG: hypothetical protein ACLP6G_13600 [Terriglobales bacterium]
MPLRPEYDEVVIRRIRATVAGFGLVLVGLFSAGAAWAQIHAVPPSVTSMGFGGRAFNGPLPSVTALGPRGYTPGFNPGFPNSKPWFGSSSSGFSGHPHHRPRYPQWGLAYYATPYYGYYDNGTDAQNYAPEDEYNGGPTIFDRRGPGYVPPVQEPERPAESSSVAAPEAVPEPSTPTVLVFKDGHQLEVENYAIVGATLYDLTEGHRRKVALAELDLTATSKQNDDRGIDFHLPAGTEAN